VPYLATFYYTELFKNKRTRRILLATIGTFLVLSIYFSVFTYRTLIKNHQQTSLMRLFGIVNSVSLLIDGEMHTMLMSMYPAKDDIDSLGVDMYYDQIHRLLKSNEQANMLKTPIYTIVYDSSQHAYEFGVSSAEKPYFRHLYKKFPDQLLEEYEAGGMIPPYQDEFGHWLSAFAPIKNKVGHTVAVLQADEKYDEFLNYVRAAIWKNILLSLFLLTLFFYVLFQILQHVLSRELMDKENLQLAMTENKKIRDQLQISLDDIKKTDTFRKEMIANFSHDLRTPLASVSGYLELILNDTSQSIQPEDTSKYIQIAYNESLRLQRLVSELFELSKLESGQIKLNEVSFSLAELAQDVLNKYQKVCDDRQIKLITEFQPTLRLIKADISWIDRLLQNLIDNAIKYVSNGGFIKITIFEDNEQQHVKVCNSGTPIPIKDLPNIFDRYFKSSNNISNQSTGLGLAIVKKIVELHHGNVRAEATDEITTFRFTLNI